MEISLDMLLVVCPLIFLAGFIDAVAGGGGLISLPAYYFVGLSPSVAAGTNKLAAAMGTGLATFSYAKAGRIDMRIGGPAAIGSLIMSAVGVLVMKQLPQDVVRWLVLGCIPVAAYFTLRGTRVKTVPNKLTARKIFFLAALVGAGAGFYDGLIGPGTGTFLILLLMNLFGKDGVTASGTAKVVNLASNITALCGLALTGDIAVGLGLSAGACGMLGAFWGSRLTIQRGSVFLRKMMLVVLALLLAKIVLDMVP